MTAECTAGLLLTQTVVSHFYCSSVI